MEEIEFEEEEEELEPPCLSPYEHSLIIALW